MNKQYQRPAVASVDGEGRKPADLGLAHGEKPPANLFITEARGRSFVRRRSRASTIA
jgi:hypothetical protein